MLTKWDETGTARHAMQNDFSPFPRIVYSPNDECHGSCDGSSLSRRAFIVRTGGATVATVVGWSALTSKARAEIEALINCSHSDHGQLLDVGADVSDEFQDYFNSWKEGVEANNQATFMGWLLEAVGEAVPSGSGPVPLDLEDFGGDIAGNLVDKVWETNKDAWLDWGKTQFDEHPYQFGGAGVAIAGLLGLAANGYYNDTNPSFSLPVPNPSFKLKKEIECHPEFGDPGLLFFELSADLNLKLEDGDWKLDARFNLFFSYHW